MLGFVFLSVPVRTVAGMSTTTILQDLTVDEAGEVITSVLAGREPGLAKRIECLTDDAIMRVVRAATTAIARLEVIHVRGVATLDRRRDDPQSLREDLMQKLHITDDHAAKVIATSRALDSRLPKTLALMEEGEVDLASATKVAHATNWLTDERAGVADAHLAALLPGKNVEQIRRAAYSAARTADPAGGIRRTTENRKGRRLTLKQRNAAAARLSISDAPADKAAEAFSQIESSAKALKTPEEPRTHDELCADIALDLLLRPYERPEAAPGPEVPPEPDIRIPQQRSVDPEQEDGSVDNGGAARPSWTKRGSGADSPRVRYRKGNRARSHRRKKR